MAHANATHMSTGFGATAPPSKRTSQVARRRRMLVAFLVMALVALGVLANYRPLQSYVDARARLESANAATEELAAQKAQLQAELGRLSQADYLESLARQDLSYTRPGEELIIVTGLGGSSASAGGDGDTAGGAATSEGSAAGQDGVPGFLERVLAPILD